MLLLSMHLAGVRARGNMLVSNLGMLETLWLAGREPRLRSAFDDVHEPGTDNLRAAGMFDIWLADDVNKVHEGWIQDSESPCSQSQAGSSTIAGG